VGLTINSGRNVKAPLNSTFKETSVKKMFLIAIAPKTTENYENVQKIFKILNLVEPKIDDVRLTIASDLKLINIILGLMSHGSLHPCCYCDQCRDDFLN
jgi:hypothetical protein